MESCTAVLRVHFECAGGGAPTAAVLGTSCTTWLVPSEACRLVTMARLSSFPASVYSTEGERKPVLDARRKRRTQLSVIGIQGLVRVYPAEPMVQRAHVRADAYVRSPPRMLVVVIF